MVTRLPCPAGVMLASAPMPPPPSAPGAALIDRLSSEDGRAAWRNNVGHALRALLDAKLADLVDAPALSALAAAFASDPASRACRTALARAAAGYLREKLAVDPRPLSAFVSEKGLAALGELVKEPDVVPERLLRELAESDAARTVMNDVLYDALTEFSDKVNPFFAEWGLPSLLRKVPFGGSVALKSFEAVRGEFDRRLEPEIRKFLQTFSKKATDRALALALSRAASPAFVALRKDTLRALLAQRLEEVVPPPGAPKGNAAEDAGLEIAERLYAEVAAELPVRLPELLAASGDRTLLEVLKSAGVPAADIEAALAALAPRLADATWPLLRASLKSPALAAWLADIAAG